MAEFELPLNLARDVGRNDTSEAPRRAWLAELPQIVNGLARRWSLELGRPFQPGGSASWVAPARTRMGTRLVLKVGWRHAESEHEAQGLRTWRGEATVLCVDAAMSEQTSALLLEACDPGTALSDVLPAQDQDTVAADLLRQLWIAPPPGHPFRSLASMCDRWAAEFDTAYAGVGPRQRLDAGLARAGLELLVSLPRTAEHTALLCTDLHPENILAARRKPWLVIDPKPYVGDPTYDPVQYMLNFPDRLADPVRFARRMATLLDLDPHRLQHWLFARCVQESPGWPDLHAVATALAP